MTISKEMATLIRRQLDAEDDFNAANKALEEAHRLIELQAQTEGLHHRDVEAAFQQMKDTR